jgi:hypothetical protein
VGANTNRNEGAHASNEVSYPAVVATPSFNTTFIPFYHADSDTFYDNQNSTATFTTLQADYPRMLTNMPFSANTDPNPATMEVYLPDGTQVAQVDINGADAGVNPVPFAIEYPQGTFYYNGTMTDTAGTRSGSLKFTNGKVFLTA